MKVPILNTSDVRQILAQTCCNCTETEYLQRERLILSLSQEALAPPAELVVEDPLRWR
jgi:hypothetical protein